MEGSHNDDQQHPSCLRCKARDWWWHLIFPLPLLIKVVLGFTLVVALYSIATLCYDYDAYVGELRAMSALRGRFDPVSEFGPWVALEQARAVLSVFELIYDMARMNWTILRNYPAILTHHVKYNSYNPITYAATTALRLRGELQTEKTAFRHHNKTML